MSPVNEKELRVYRRVTHVERKKVLDTFAHWERVHGRPPSQREIVEHVDLPTGTVGRILRDLVADKKLVRVEGARKYLLPRNLASQIVSNVAKSIAAIAPRLPILGTVAAGQPIEVVDGDPDTLPIPAEWCQGDCYLLRVAGDSMEGDGILDGDLVLVQATNVVMPGAILVCWVRDVGATIKRVETVAEKAQLVSSNKAFAPIEAPHGTIVQGRVVWIFRRLGSKKRRRT